MPETADDHFLLAPPAHFITGSHENVSRSKMTDNDAIRSNISPGSNEPVQRNTAATDAGEMRSRPVEMPERGESFSQTTTSNNVCETIISCAQQTVHTVKDEAGRQNILTHVTGNYNDIKSTIIKSTVSGLGVEMPNENRKSALPISQGKTPGIFGLINVEKNVQRNETLIVSEISQEKKREPSLKNILNSTKQETSGDSFSSHLDEARIQSGHLIPHIPHISDGVETPVGRERMTENDITLEPTEDLSTKQCDRSFKDIEFDTFEAAWSVIEKSRIFQNAIDNHNRELDATEKKNNESFMTGSRYVSSSQVPDIVNAAWNVIVTSELFKDRLEKQKKILGMTNFSESLGESKTPILPVSEVQVFHTVPTEGESLDICSSEGEEEHEIVGVTRELKLATKYTNESCRGTSQRTESSIQSRMASASWNAIESSPMFKNEIKKVSKTSNVKENEHSALAGKGESNDTSKIFSRTFRTIERKETSCRARIEQESEVEQDPTLSGERIILSAKDEHEIVQKALDVVKKSDAFSYLSRRHGSEPKGPEERITPLNEEGIRQDPNIINGVHSTLNAHGGRPYGARGSGDNVNTTTSFVAKRNVKVSEVKCCAVDGGTKLRTDMQRISNAESTATTSYIGILSSPQKDYSSQKHSDRKKVHFNTSEKQDDPFNTSKKSNILLNTTHDRTERITNDQQRVLHDSVDSTGYCGVPYRSSLAESPAVVYAHKAADIFSTIAQRMHSPKFCSVGTNITSNVMEEQRYYRKTASIAKVKGGLGIEKVGAEEVDTKKTPMEDSRGSSVVVMESTGQQASEQIHIRREEKFRVVRMRADKCIQAEQVVPLERPGCATPYDDVDHDRNRVLPRKSVTSGVQVDLLDSREK